MNFGEILTNLRDERGIYQKELAAYLNVSIGTISNYENGVHYPDLSTLCQIADYFNVTTDYLLGRTKYSADLTLLNRPLTKDYTITDFINTTLELPSRDVSVLVEYAELLKLRQQVNSPR